MVNRPARVKGIKDVFKTEGVGGCAERVLPAAVRGAGGREGKATQSARKALPPRLMRDCPPQWYHDLTPSEISMIQECEDEFRRQESTQFERIFPDQHFGEVFVDLFESPRQANKVLHQWVLCRHNPPQPLIDLLDMKPCAVPPTASACRCSSNGSSGSNGSNVTACRPLSPRSKAKACAPMLKGSLRASTTR